MDEFLSLIKLIRQIEALFLPLFPSKWRSAPPSYRVALPLLKKLALYKRRFPWAEALLQSIREEGYRAYHKDGLGTGQMLPVEMRWMRFILAVVAFTLIIAFTPNAESFSLWIKFGLLFGSSMLLIYASMRLSISAMWASWGIVFAILGVFISKGLTAWAMISLGLSVLVWHVPLLNTSGSWRWFDWVATLPILFYLMQVIPWSQSFSRWQNGLLSIFLWLLVWIAISRLNQYPRLSRALQFFWPASLVGILIVVECLKPFLNYMGIYHVFLWPLLWIFGTLILSFLMSELSQQILIRSFLFRFGTVVLIFAIYAASIIIKWNRDELEGWIDNQLALLDYTIWPLWWVVGANIIMDVHRFTTVLLKWVQALLTIWVFPLALLVFPILAYYLGWISYLAEEIGGSGVAVLSLGFALSAVLFAWRRKETVLREWVFWGFFTLLLFQYYLSEAVGTTSAYENRAVASLAGFSFICAWLFWLSYDVVGGTLKGFNRMASRVGTVVLMGALLWLLMATLWLSYVDEGFPIGTINYYLFMGFTFLGIPLIIYRLILRQYLQLESSQDLPWGLILIIGIGLVQVLQGVEHYVVAWIEHISPNTLHEELHQALLGGVQMESVAPAWVFDSSWNLAWRSVRWLSIAFTLSFVVYRSRRKTWSRPVVISTAFFTSLAAGTAEAVWLWWPGMSTYWAVVFRPWIITLAVWNLSFVKIYVIYGLAGLLWGWVLYRWISRRQNLKPMDMNTMPTSVR